jgi:NitT/TauT family transport system permease protein
MMNRFSVWRLALHPCTLVVYLVLAWQLIAQLGYVDPYLLPPAFDVLKKVAQLVGNQSFLSAVGLTAAETVVSFIIATPVGIAIGFFLAENKYWGTVFKPFFHFLFSIPKSIFLPMFILAFGIGFWEKVGFGIFSTIFIVVISMAVAAESVRPEFKIVARCYRASSSQTFFHVYLPAMLPGILEALRLAMIFNFTGIILAEMYASRGGLGNLISTWGESYMLTELLAGVVIISAIAIAFNETLRYLENKYRNWTEE